MFNLFFLIFTVSQLLIFLMQDFVFKFENINFIRTFFLFIFKTFIFSILKF